LTRLCTKCHFDSTRCRTFRTRRCDRFFSAGGRVKTLARVLLVYRIPPNALTVLKGTPKSIHDALPEKRQSDSASLDVTFDPCGRWVSVLIYPRAGIPADTWRRSHLSGLDGLGRPGQLDEAVRRQRPHSPTVRIGRRSVWSVWRNDGRVLRRGGGQQQDPAGAPTQTEATKICQRPGPTAM
jgi:hypothetical protein